MPSGLVDLPRPLLERLSAELEIPVAVVWAFATVEAGDQGPFLDLRTAGGAPLLLFERHIFHRLTDGRFDDVAPDLSAATPGGYGLYRAQPGRLLRAVLLDAEAAWQSVSLGMWQVLGAGAERIGYRRDGDASPAEVMARSCLTLEGQATAFARFVGADGALLAALRRDPPDWPTASERYNGTGYRSHPAGPYDERLAAAWRLALVAVAGWGWSTT